MIEKFYKWLTGRCWHKWSLENGSASFYYCMKCGKRK